MEKPAWTKAFAIAHDLEIGYFLTLKKLYTRLDKVTSSTSVMLIW
jgi:hypothetical protein